MVGALRFIKVAGERVTMNPIIEFLRQTEGTVFVNEDGYKDDFKLKRPLTR
jgi:hypothetical protein